MENKGITITNNTTLGTLVPSSPILHGVSMTYISTIAVTATSV